MARYALLIYLTMIAALSAAERKALVIGNAAYQGEGVLRNPVHDATDMAAALKSCGFAVTLKTDVHLEAFQLAVETFVTGLGPQDTALLYFAGHGVQARGGTYLLPTDFTADNEAVVRFRSVSVDETLAMLEGRQGGANIIILDACRNNPFRSWDRGSNRGLGVVQAPRGSFIAYATAPGSTAADGDGRNGRYTAALLKHLRTPGLSIEDLFRNVRGDLGQAQPVQTPWESSSLVNRFYFVPAGAASGPAPVVSTPATPAPAEDPLAQFQKESEAQALVDRAAAMAATLPADRRKALWEQVRGQIPDLPSSQLDETLRARVDTELAALTAKAWVPKWASAHGEDRYGRWADLEVGDQVQRMRWIPPGTFTMGSPESEKQAAIAGGSKAEWVSDEVQHEVRLSRGYWLGNTEVTQGLWRTVMGTTVQDQRDKAGSGKGIFGASPETAMYYVSWDETQDFLRRLNGRTSGLGARLPREAEWEYACRAGTTGMTYRGDFAILGKNNAPGLDGIGWYAGNSGQGWRGTGGADSSGWSEKQYDHSKAGVWPVGQKAPNGFGLYDMIGNVWEWCDDWYGAYAEGRVTDPTGPASGSQRVLRGGGWDDYAHDCRAADRHRYSADYGWYGLGFRLCVPDQAK